MKKRYYILGLLLLVFLGIQLVPSELPEVKANNPGDIIQSGLVNQDVAALLKKSCYDCHSNESVFPWYSHIAPSSWLVAKDIREGREELNFSEWENYDMMKKLSLLDDIAIAVKEGEMPMQIYLLMHPSSKLDENQRQSIIDWAEESMDIVAEEED
ncbi:heme-binding domain-containing protein [Shivajiella indica]|uniref:Heme-binding domain-containing protein n=1 Tax=Shivajiella indica TaxID=872115 RepID=A0ABW5B6C4_9BACT